jgi:hypothetical protein
MNVFNFKRILSRSQVKLTIFKNLFQILIASTISSCNKFKQKHIEISTSDQFVLKCSENN